MCVCLLGNIHRYFSIIIIANQQLKYNKHKSARENDLLDCQCCVTLAGIYSIIYLIPLLRTPMDIYNITSEKKRDREGRNLCVEDLIHIFMLWVPKPRVFVLLFITYLMIVWPLITPFPSGVNEFTSIDWEHGWESPSKKRKKTITMWSNVFFCFFFVVMRNNR